MPQAGLGLDVCLGHAGLEVGTVGGIDRSSSKPELGHGDPVKEGVDLGLDAGGGQGLGPVIEDQLLVDPLRGDHPARVMGEGRWLER